MNCGVAKPLIGVFKVHVTIPELLLSTFVTLYPLVLFIVLKICVLDVNPLGDSNMFILDIEFAANITWITPWSLVNLPVSGSMTTRSGASI